MFKALARWGWLWVLLLGVSAPAAELTSEQRALIMQLSPEQREAALKTLGKTPTATVEQEVPETPVLVLPTPQGQAPTAIEQRYARQVPGQVKMAAKQGEKKITEKGVEGTGEKTADQVEPTKQVLKQFGYELFSGVPTTFAPVTDIPVPVDYIIGPGDSIRLQIYGKDNAEYHLVVTREGTLLIPNIGPVMVAGLTYEQLLTTLRSRITGQMIGVKANISMGPLRSIRVFVLGDVARPGSYTVSSLSTMTNALFVSGGIKPVGSLRKIQLKRAGKLITEMDLYDLLLRGDTSADARLLPGDVIFVPPIGATIAVAGEVKRPAIYELKNEKTLAEVLAMAGDLLPTAYMQVAQLDRISERRNRTLLDLDLTQPEAWAQTVQDGDVVRIYSVWEKMEDIVLLSGHVKRPGGYQWREGMWLTELIGSADDLLSQPDLDYLMIRRELPPDRRIQVLTVNLRKALADPRGTADVQLTRRDQVLVFSGTTTRESLVEPLLGELRQQARKDEPSPIVYVNGQVRFAGAYPLAAGMRVSDLIRAGGQLAESAYGLEAELTRYQVLNGQRRETRHLNINLAAILAGDLSQDLVLQAYDELTIKDTPLWHEQESVDIRGEVRFPGRYPITRGETLSAVLKRAGGLTAFAAPNGAVFMREDLRKKEQERFDQMAMQMRQQLAGRALQPELLEKDGQQSLTTLQQLLAQLENTKAAGRLVIDLPAIIAEKEAADVALKDGDVLFIPVAAQEVSVMGEVFHQTSHLYSEGKSALDYVDLSGGATRNADDAHIYVIRANGAVVPAKSGGWLGFRAAARIAPGDTVVVPLDIERVRPLVYWTSISQILYQLGVAVAAWNTVGVL